MKKTIMFTVAALGAAALSACHNGTTTTTNMTTMTDNMGAMADNGMSAMGVDNALNMANSTIATGQNMATDLRTHDPDMNLANGM